MAQFQLPPLADDTQDRIDSLLQEEMEIIQKSTSGKDDHLRRLRNTHSVSTALAFHLVI